MSREVRHALETKAAYHINGASVRHLGLNLWLFLFPLVLCIILAQATTAHGQELLAADEWWKLGSGFSLLWTPEYIEIRDDADNVIFSTVPGQPFISASTGNDSVVGSSGAFNITQVDQDKCSGQHISSVSDVPWEKTATGSAVQINGNLSECGDASAPFSLTFWVPKDLPDRVAFYLKISSSSNVDITLKKLYFTFASHAEEDFYGLGAQASFASLKNQSVPIFSREQGVGRGDQPITGYANQNGM